MTDPAGNARRVTVTAQPNIALVKYWGKKDIASNTPAVGSLSVTLADLTTTTTVAPAAADRFRLNGAEEPAMAARTFAFADAMYAAFNTERPALAITTENSFPTAAGLASSASGFAALARAFDALAGWRLPLDTLAGWACRGSGSAPRSLVGGFARLDIGTGSEPVRLRALASPEDFPLQVLVAVTSRARKTVGSTAGMELTRTTSPFYKDWVRSHPADLDTTEAAVAARDFAALADVSEHSCLKMHAVMQAAQPGLIYWNAATLAALHEVRSLRAAGTPVFFTIDAGPQLKAICTPAVADQVRETLAAVPGVETVLETGLGDGAALKEPTA